MSNTRTAYAAHGATALFVLLWSSGAIFSKWGLAHATPFAFLVLRFMLALAALLVLARAARQPCLPPRGTRARVMATGLTMIGGYSICYFLALDHGITPGVLATTLGAQPLLTLVLLERRFALPRVSGLALALAGLALVVWESIGLARYSALGMLYALGALLCMTGGAILQKSLRQAPLRVLPLQYAVGLLLCLACVPLQPWHLADGPGLWVPLLWLGLVISVGATLLLYRLIQAGNLVNVTSLFYLVPGVTALLDYLLLGNRLAPLSLAGMAAILAGLALVFRAAPRS
ncbi:DMT family transporter [Bordetella sp. BOR01]|uniref:DMT family transporter n=1 Tax=Bordetella sp. BOR01 TaxID=2854779 RepID=UPI001C44EC4B|nr:DMT family transporter [Bordetella sp. BOR01]MBV7486809.1 DMT family transporter [Bordetella sp. BOR01]